MFNIVGEWSDPGHTGITALANGREIPRAIDVSPPRYKVNFNFMRVVPYFELRYVNAVSKYIENLAIEMTR